MPNDGVTKIDASNPEVKAIVDAAIAEATKGLKDNRDAILNEKKTLEARLQETASMFDGVDPKMLKTLAERMKNDEETKLMAEGKIDEVFNRRTEALKKDYESRVKAQEERANALEGAKTSAESKMKSLIIETMVRQAAAEVGLVPAALEDAIFRSKNVFALDDGLNPVAKASDGTIILGKDAKTPLSTKEWLETMKEKAPHWFPGSTGTGAQGARGQDGSSGYTISREDARDVSKYRAAKAAAEKAGQTLQIVES
jgi:hypothetical protein